MPLIYDRFITVHSVTVEAMWMFFLLCSVLTWYWYNIFQVIWDSLVWGIYCWIYVSKYDIHFGCLEDLVIYGFLHLPINYTWMFLFTNLEHFNIIKVYNMHYIKCLVYLFDRIFMYIQCLPSSRLKGKGALFPTWLFRG